MYYSKPTHFLPQNKLVEIINFLFKYCRSLLMFYILTCTIAIFVCYKKNNGFCAKSTAFAIAFPLLYIISSI